MAYGITTADIATTVENDYFNKQQNPVDMETTMTATMNDNTQTVYAILNANDIYADVSTDGAITEVSIDWGDWKHSHRFTDYVMSQHGYIKMNEEITEEDGSDCYSSIHYYVRTKDNIEPHKI